MNSAYTGRMKSLAITAYALVVFVITTPTQAETNSCEHSASNVAARECYSKQNARVTAEVDSLAADVAAKFRKDARDYDVVIGGALRKAASGIAGSQRTWKNYREQYCTAILDSFTTGTGAETAYEKCEVELARDRLKTLTQLRNVFSSVKQK